MSMPTSKLATLSTLFIIGALAACGSDESDVDAPPVVDDAPVVQDATKMEQVEKQATLDAAADGRIDCAIGDAAEFTRNCLVERIRNDAGQILIVRHADGGFRRFRVLTDGRGLELEEGFNDVKISIIDNDIIEVNSGGNIYRLPANVKASAPVAADSTDNASLQTSTQKAE